MLPPVKLNLFFLQLIDRTTLSHVFASLLKRGLLWIRPLFIRGWVCRKINRKSQTLSLCSCEQARVNKAWLRSLLPLSVIKVDFCTLWPDSADDKLMICFLIFRRKKIFTFHVNGLCQILFFGKAQKNILKWRLLRFLPYIQSVNKSTMFRMPVTNLSSRKHTYMILTP